MKLYLVQHGDALPKDVDPERALSESGTGDVKRLGKALDRSGIRVSRVLHSGKRRAQQTAELLAQAIAPGAEPVATEGLNPLDPPDALITALGDLTDDILIVGHQPFMGKALSYLLCGNEDGMSAAFVPGTTACLERNGEGRWSLGWMLRPELLSE